MHHNMLLCTQIVQPFILDSGMKPHDLKDMSQNGVKDRQTDDDMNKPESKSVGNNINLANTITFTSFDEEPREMEDIFGTEYGEFGIICGNEKLPYDNNEHIVTEMSTLPEWEEFTSEYALEPDKPELINISKDIEIPSQVEMDESVVPDASMEHMVNFDINQHPEHKLSPVTVQSEYIANIQSEKLPAQSVPELATVDWIPQPVTLSTAGITEPVVTLSADGITEQVILLKQPMECLSEQGVNLPTDEDTMLLIEQVPELVALPTDVVPELATVGWMPQDVTLSTAGMTEAVLTPSADGISEQVVLLKQPTAGLSEVFSEDGTGLPTDDVLKLPAVEVTALVALPTDAVPELATVGVVTHVVTLPIAGITEPVVKPSGDGISEQVVLLKLPAEGVFEHFNDDTILSKDETKLPMDRFTECMALPHDAVPELATAGVTTQVGILPIAGMTEPVVTLSSDGISEQVILLSQPTEGLSELIVEDSTCPTDEITNVHAEGVTELVSLPTDEIPALATHGIMPQAVTLSTAGITEPVVSLCPDGISEQVVLLKQPTEGLSELFSYDGTELPIDDATKLPTVEVTELVALPTDAVPELATVGVVTHVVTLPIAGITEPIVSVSADGISEKVVLLKQPTEGLSEVFSTDDTALPSEEETKLPVDEITELVALPADPVPEQAKAAVMTQVVTLPIAGITEPIVSVSADGISEQVVLLKQPTEGLSEQFTEGETYPTDERIFFPTLGDIDILALSTDAVPDMATPGMVHQTVVLPTAGVTEPVVTFSADGISEQIVLLKQPTECLSELFAEDGTDLPIDDATKLHTVEVTELVALPTDAVPELATVGVVTHVVTLPIAGITEPVVKPSGDGISEQVVLLKQPAEGVFEHATNGTILSNDETKLPMDKFTECMALPHAVPELATAGVTTQAGVLPTAGMTEPVVTLSSDGISEQVILLSLPTEGLSELIVKDPTCPTDEITEVPSEGVTELVSLPTDAIPALATHGIMPQALTLSTAGITEPVVSLCPDGISEQVVLLKQPTEGLSELFSEDGTELPIDDATKLHTVEVTELVTLPTDAVPELATVGVVTHVVTLPIAGITEPVVKPSGDGISEQVVLLKLPAEGVFENFNNDTILSNDETKLPMDRFTECMALPHDAVPELATAGVTTQVCVLPIAGMTEPVATLSTDGISEQVILLSLPTKGLSELLVEDSTCPTDEITKVPAEGVTELVSLPTDAITELAIHGIMPQAVTLSTAGITEPVVSLCPDGISEEVVLLKQPTEGLSELFSEDGTELPIDDATKLHTVEVTELVALPTDAVPELATVGVVTQVVTLPIAGITEPIVSVSADGISEKVVLLKQPTEGLSEVFSTGDTALPTDEDTKLHVDEITELVALPADTVPEQAKAAVMTQVMTLPIAGITEPIVSVSADGISEQVVLLKQPTEGLSEQLTEGETYPTDESILFPTLGDIDFLALSTDAVPDMAASGVVPQTVVLPTAGVTEPVVTLSADGISEQVVLLKQPTECLSEVFSADDTTLPTDEDTKLPVDEVTELVALSADAVHELAKAGVMTQVVTLPLAGITEPIVSVSADGISEQVVLLKQPTEGLSEQLTEDETYPTDESILFPTLGFTEIVSLPTDAIPALATHGIMPQAVALSTAGITEPVVSLCPDGISEQVVLLKQPTEGLFEEFSDDIALPTDADTAEEVTKIVSLHDTVPVQATEVATLPKAGLTEPIVTLLSDGVSEKVVLLKKPTEGLFEEFSEGAPLSTDEVTNLPAEEFTDLVTNDSVPESATQGWMSPSSTLSTAGITEPIVILCADGISEQVVLLKQPTEGLSEVFSEDGTILPTDEDTRLPADEVTELVELSSDDITELAKIAVLTQLVTLPIAGITEPVVSVSADGISEQVVLLKQPTEGLSEQLTEGETFPTDAKVAGFPTVGDIGLFSLSTDVVTDLAASGVITQLEMMPTAGVTEPVLKLSADGMREQVVLVKERTEYVIDKLATDELATGEIYEQVLLFPSEESTDSSFTFAIGDRPQHAKEIPSDGVTEVSMSLPTTGLSEQVGTDETLTLSFEEMPEHSTMVSSDDVTELALGHPKKDVKQASKDAPVPIGKLTSDGLPEPISKLPIEDLPEPVGKLPIEDLPKPVGKLSSEVLPEPVDILPSKDLPESVGKLPIEDLHETVDKLPSEDLPVPVDKLPGEDLPEPVEKLSGEDLFEPTGIEPVGKLPSEGLQEPVGKLPTDEIYEQVLLFPSEESPDSSFTLAIGDMPQHAKAIPSDGVTEVSMSLPTEDLPEQVGTDETLTLLLEEMPEHYTMVSSEDVTELALGHPKKDVKQASKDAPVSIGKLPSDGLPEPISKLPGEGLPEPVGKQPSDGLPEPVGKLPSQDLPDAVEKLPSTYLPEPVEKLPSEDLPEPVDKLLSKDLPEPVEKLSDIELFEPTGIEPVGKLPSEGLQEPVGKLPTDEIYEQVLLFSSEEGTDSSFTFAIGEMPQHANKIPSDGVTEVSMSLPTEDLSEQVGTDETLTLSLEEMPEHSTMVSSDDVTELALGHPKKDVKQASKDAPVPIGKLTSDGLPEPICKLPSEGFPEPVGKLPSEDLAEPVDKLSSKDLPEPVDNLPGEDLTEPVDKLPSEDLLEPTGIEPVGKLPSEGLQEPVGKLPTDEIYEQVLLFPSDESPDSSFTFAIGDMPQHVKAIPSDGVTEVAMSLPTDRST